MLLIQAFDPANSLLSEALYSTQIEPQAIAAATKTAEVIVKQFTAYGTYILSIVFTIEIARSSLLNERIDAMKLVRTFLVLLVFINYNETIGRLNELMVGIFSNLPQATAKGLVENTPPEDFSLLSLFTVNYLSSNIFISLAFTVQCVVLLIRKILVLFLYAAGPIAFLASMIPSFGDGVLKNWFRNYVSVQCWALTLFVLNTLFLFFAQNTQSGNDSSTAIYIGFTIMFLITPSLTNKYLGNAAANGLMSKMVGVTTGLVLMSKQVISHFSKAQQATQSKAADLGGSMAKAGKNEHGAPQFVTKGGSVRTAQKPRTAEN